MSHARRIVRSMQKASYQLLGRAESKGTPFKCRRYVDTVFSTNGQPSIKFYRATKGYHKQRTPTARAGIIA